MHDLTFKIKHTLIALLVVMSSYLGNAVTVNASPLTTFAAKCTGGGIVGFPTWYDGLECNDSQPKITKLNDFWVIALNLLQMLTMLVVYFAIGYTIWGGFKYIKSQGDPGKISEAKMAIIQAIAGLCIALGAVAIINFVQGII